jgi:hypothetical protein
MSYQYWVVRFVPNIARGEFTNIGIVCGRDGADWAVHFDPRYVRNHGNLGPELRELSLWTRWFQRTIERYGTTGFDERPVSSGWITHLRSRQANSVQFSEPAPINVESAREGVALLFPHLVERETSRRGRRNITRKSLRAEVRETLEFQDGLIAGYDLFIQPKVQISKLRGSFDLARTDGDPTGLTNVWAFNVASLDVLEREIQSWNYLVNRFRAEGATLQLAPSRSTVLGGDTPIDVVYDAPESQREAQWRSDIFEAAKEAWELNHVSARSLDEFHRVDFASARR